MSSNRALLEQIAQQHEKAGKIGLRKKSEDRYGVPFQLADHGHANYPAEASDRNRAYWRPAIPARA
jgi:hypothetical protein